MKANVFYENELGQMVPLVSETYIKTALDTLAEICKMTQEELANNPNTYERRASAEEILRHYREGELVRDIKENGLTINVNGAIPVRPKTLSEDKPGVHGGVRVTEDTLNKVRVTMNSVIQERTGDLDPEDFISALLNKGLVFREIAR